VNPGELLMKTVVEAWGQADLEPVRAALDENVVWKSASTCKDGVFRFGGVYRGKSNVLALLALLSANYFFQRYTMKEIISRGEIVWGLFDTDGAYIPTGGSDEDRKPIHFETAFRWRIRDGKILEAQSFFDTAALLVQQGNFRGAQPLATARTRA
jgi:ketosteroid isomerase-like protein